MPEVTRVRESRYVSRGGDDDDYSSDDERSSYGRALRPGAYRTVQRYRVAPSRADFDDDARSVRSERYTPPPRAERVEVDRRVERYVDREPERSSRSVIIEREREREPERMRTVVYERERERERPREPTSARPWERERERPWERETDVSVERRVERREEKPMQLERYQRETEYYDHPEPAPQPIIIRQRAPEPQQIIVQEAPQPQPIVLAREEPSYEIIQRSEVQEIAPRPEPRRDDEEYYYRREVRETDGRGRDDDYAMARYDRRDVRPPSVSDYSDEEQVIVRRERKSFRSRSPRHKRHLAEGALAGAGAAALLASHREKQGMEVAHRGRNVVGGAVLGAIGTEIAGRARSRFRDERSRGRRSRSGSSDSHSKLKIGLGLAALGVAAAVANKVNQNRIANRDEQGRGRSRTRSVSRRRSRSAFSRTSRTRSTSKHQDPKHRASAIAKAGAASAAVAGVVEYARNKSRERQGKRSRSRSRLRTGVPIAATGLAGAAVAGLYEMRKAKQEDKEDSLAESRRHTRRSSRTSRSRSRTRSTGYVDPIDPELGMVQYGADPVYTKHTTTTESYDPVMSGGGSHRSRSRSRRREYSSDSDRDVRRSRSHSRVRDLAGGALATGAAAIGINKLKKRHDRKRDEREDRRYEDSPDDYYDTEHYSEGYSDSPPRASGGAYYPQTTSFPPPPTGGYTQHTTTSTTHVNDVPQPQYDPRDYVVPDAYHAPTDNYGRTSAQRGRDGDNVSPTKESPEEDRLIRYDSPTSLMDRPNNRMVTFAPLSPTSSRRLEKIRSNLAAQNQSSSSLPRDESEPDPEPKHHRRRHSEPASNRHSHRHRRRPSDIDDSEQDVEALPDRFDESGRSIEHSGKEEMVERIFSDVQAIVDGRVSWRDMLRPLFERR